MNLDSIITWKELLDVLESVIMGNITHTETCAEVDLGEDCNCGCNDALLVSRQIIDKLRKKIF